jgi:hypothetical protein
MGTLPKGTAQRFQPLLDRPKGRVLSTEEFADFKRYVHSQNGNIPDHTKLASLLESRGQVSLGIVDETSDSISLGTVVKLTEPALKRDLQSAAINVALQIKSESLSLYVYDGVKDTNDTDRVKELAKRWVQCIRNRIEVKQFYQSMMPTQPLVLRPRRNRNFCFKWLGGLSLSR